jgi:hypothetical protein
MNDYPAGKHRIKPTSDERIAALEADLTQAVQMYVDAAQERDEAIAAEIKADAELAKVKDHLANFRESYSDLTTENRRVVDERDQAITELAKVKAERVAAAVAKEATASNCTHLKAAIRKFWWVDA